MEAGVFASLIEHDQVQTVVLGIERAVIRSFAKQKEPGRIILVSGSADAKPTAAEAKRRSQICVKMFRELRGDLSWTVERILDEMPRFLQMELDGVSWEPQAKRATWAAGQK